MNTLFQESIRKRPTMADPRITRRAAEILFERREDYGIEVDDDGHEDAIADIERVIGYGSDGYERARDLERKGWNVDASTVEWLNDDTRYDALRQAVRSWVAAEGIKPALAVGASITFPCPRYYAEKGCAPTTTGEIVSVNETEATYTVFVAEFGHVRQGTGTHGTILPYEEVEGSDEAQSLPQPETVEPCEP